MIMLSIYNLQIISGQLVDVIVIYLQFAKKNPEH